MSVRAGSCIITVTGQETVQDVETVSGTGLYTVVTNKVNPSYHFFYLFSFYVLPPLSLHPFVSPFLSLFCSLTSPLLANTSCILIP
jgi:hypothetical protein